MRRVILGLLVAAIVLAFPIVGSAGGWAGSRYDKSECTYSKAPDSLFCESTYTVEIFTTERMSFSDESCPNSLRGVSRTGWFVEVFRVFDAYTGHTPVRQHNVFGNTSPLFGLEHWRDFTDTDLGCV